MPIQIEILNRLSDSNYTALKLCWDFETNRLSFLILMSLKYNVFQPDEIHGASRALINQVFKVKVGMLH